MNNISKTYLNPDALIKEKVNPSTTDVIVGKKTAEGGEIFNDYVNNKATSQYSHAEGDHTITSNIAEHASGKYNKSNPDTLFSIGNGTSESNRKNAFEVKNNGLSIIENLEVNKNSKLKGKVATGSTYANGSHSFSSGSGNETKLTLTYVSHTTTPASSIYNLVVSGDQTSVVPKESILRIDGDFYHVSDSTFDNTNTTLKFSNAGLSAQPKNISKLSGVAFGTATHSEGNKTLALSEAAHAEGSETKALGNATHAEGLGTTAKGNFSHTEGYGSVTFGNTSHAEGWKTTAKGNSSHAEGLGSFSFGDVSHTEGYWTRANQIGSHAEGTNTLAAEKHSHAEGIGTKALGYGAHAEGINAEYIYISRMTTPSNLITIWEGKKDSSFYINRATRYTEIKPGDTVLDGKLNPIAGITKILWDSVNSILKLELDKTVQLISDRAKHYITLSGSPYKAVRAAHVEGTNTTASGNSSHAEGNTTTASGYCSHAEGNLTIASGYYSHAEGKKTTTLNTAEHTEGKYNKSNTGATDDLRTIHSVGIGTSDDDYKNAHEIMTNGDQYILGVGDYDGTNAVTANAAGKKAKTLKTVIDGKAEKSHTHTKSQITDFPTALPANGGTSDNSNKLGGQLPSYYSKEGHTHNYIETEEDNRNVDTKPLEYYNRKIRFRGLKSSGTLGLSAYGNLMGGKAWADETGDRAFELLFCGDGNIYTRIELDRNTWKDWDELMYRSHLGSILNPLVTVTAGDPSKAATASLAWGGSNYTLTLNNVKGATGGAGAPAGFGTPTATVTTLEPGSQATVKVTSSGLNIAKVFNFEFGIPKGDKGDPGSGGGSGSGVGQKTSQGGEIFNDYTNNIANSNSHAEGEKTSASGETSYAGGSYAKAVGKNSFAFGCINENHIINKITAKASSGEIIDGVTNPWLKISNQTPNVIILQAGTKVRIYKASGQSPTSSSVSNLINSAESITIKSVHSSDNLGITYNISKEDYDKISKIATPISADVILFAYNPTTAERKGSISIGESNNAYAENSTVLGSFNMSHHANSLVCGSFADTGIMSQGPGPRINRLFIIGNGNQSARGNALYVDNTGQIHSSKTTISTADYAEMFEWKDGNPEKEDRVGMLVDLEGDKLVPANNGYFLGVVSATPGVLGNDPMDWHDKFKKDEWGREIWKTVEINKYYLIDNDVETEVSKEYHDEHPELTYRVETKSELQRELNPEYDVQKDYVNRQYRSEWAAVGMMGQLRIRQDGTLKVGSFCKPVNGVATNSDNGYYVMKIFNEKQALVLIK